MLPPGVRDTYERCQAPSGHLNPGESYPRSATMRRRPRDEADDTINDDGDDVDEARRDHPAVLPAVLAADLAAAEGTKGGRRREREGRS